jgi:hypothetical protein
MRLVLAGFTIVSVFVLAVMACGGGKAKPDAAVDAFESTCGHPGDVGNELGIGKFCNDLADCQNNMSAALCSILGDSTTHFCTKTCSGSGSAGQCGTATTCACQGSGTSGPCGCTPTVCLGP